MYWWYYYYGYPPYPAPYLDPLSMMYAWSYMWVYWVSMMYYIEMFRILLDMWRRMAESVFKTAQTPP